MIEVLCENFVPVTAAAPLMRNITYSSSSTTTDILVHLKPEKSNILKTIWNSIST